MVITISSVTSTEPSHWKYVSEGGATVVFSYVGPPHETFDGTVLRLRKAGVQTPILEKQHLGILDDALAVLGDEEPEEPDDASIVFQERCLERLIPPIHLPRLSSVRVDRAWLEEFARAHEADRPLNRTSVGGIDTSKNKAVLANDLVGGVGLAVEIKPKWSFLPNSTHLSPTTHLIKSKTCRFCMHSHMRSGGGEAVSLGYCPLDLFSNNPLRMRKAIYSLYDNWLKSDGNVNNLKIFVMGKKIDVSERFSMLETHEPSDSAIREAFAQAMLPLLINTPVLRLLNKIQRTLDALDIEGLSSLWKKVQDVANATSKVNTKQSSPYPPPILHIGQGATNPTLADWSAFIDNYLSRPPFNHSSPSPDDLRYYLIAYLLSATFKDCSVIVRMDLLNPDRAPPVIDPSKVTIIDLDPKNMLKLKKWEELDQIIVNAYAEVPLAERKVCLDDWLEAQPESSK